MLLLTMTISSVFLIGAAMFLLTSSVTAEKFYDKIDQRVLADTEDGQTAHFLIILSEQADVSGAATLRSKAQKGQYVTNLLRQTAARTQPSLIAQLDRLGVSYRTYWITNMIAAQGDRSVVEALAQNPAVARIEANRAIKLLEAPEVVTSEPVPEDSPEAIEWGVQKIGAPAVWQMGYRGEGVVIANQDTGYDWDHPAVINQYRGWDGKRADHNYHWWDAIHEDISGNGTNPCGFDSPEPCDDHSHGTHTVGTSVGATADGNENQIGVAPGAKWIGCRNMESGTGRPSTYTECFQFFMAPTDLKGENPDATLAPHVVSNSWACPHGAAPSGEECEVNSFKSTIENMRAAGIMVVVSNGNNGSACSTTLSPPGYLDAATSVGATDSSDSIAAFSSRGPVTADGSNRLKPDISAPGVSVRSSTLAGNYSTFSGTSMASPHVAGAVALLWNAEPSLQGNIDMTEELLFANARQLTTFQNCGDVPGNSIPNNTFGYGRLDIHATILDVFDAQIELTKTVSTEPNTCAQSDEITVPSGTDITYCYRVTNTGSITFTLHTLQDQQLGQLLANEPYTLTPSRTFTYTITTPITQSQLYTATWSANNSNNLAVEASDSVTITVEPLTLYLPLVGKGN
jgi:subtilisin family serine protease